MTFVEVPLTPDRFTAPYFELSSEPSSVDSFCERASTKVHFPDF